MKDLFTGIGVFALAAAFAVSIAIVSCGDGEILEMITDEDKQLSYNLELGALNVINECFKSGADIDAVVPYTNNPNDPDDPGWTCRELQDRFFPEPDPEPSSSSVEPDPGTPSSSSDSGQASVSSSSSESGSDPQNSSSAVATQSSSSSAAGNQSSSSAAASTLTCDPWNTGNLTLNAGGSMTPPVVRCGTTTVSASSITWGGAAPPSWSNLAAGEYKNVTATASCSGTSQTAACAGSLTVRAASSSSAALSSSSRPSSSSIALSSSSAGGTTATVTCASVTKTVTVPASVGAAPAVTCSNGNATNVTFTGAPTWNTATTAATTYTVRVTAATCGTATVSGLPATCGTITVVMPSSSSVAASSSSVTQSSAGGGGGCQYQASWCGGSPATASAVSKSVPTSGGNCFFATVITKLCFNQSGVTINGVAFGQGNIGCWNNDKTPPAKADGGYYILLPGGVNDQWGSGGQDITAGSAPVCGN